MPCYGNAGGNGWQSLKIIPVHSLLGRPGAPPSCDVAHSARTSRSELFSRLPLMRTARQAWPKSIAGDDRNQQSPGVFSVVKCPPSARQGVSRYLAIPYFMGFAERPQGDEIHPRHDAVSNTSLTPMVWRRFHVTQSLRTQALQTVATSELDPLLFCTEP